MRKTDRQTKRQTQRERERETGGGIESYGQMDKLINSERDRARERGIVNRKERYAKRWRDNE